MKQKISRSLNRRPYRFPERETLISESEVKKKAFRLLQERAFVPLTWATLDILATGGVLSFAQLRALTGISHRTLIRYYKDHLVNRLPNADFDFGAFAMPDTYPERVLYAIGPVGAELLRQRFGRSVHLYSGDAMRLQHDLLCNQVVVSISLVAFDRTWALLWKSKYEATIRDGNDAVALEPDALIEFYDENQRLRARFLIEYQNEQDRNRVAGKIQRYEEMHRHGHWRRYWQQMPPVLFAWTHDVVGKHLKEAVQQTATTGLRNRYYGKPLKVLQDDRIPAQMWQEVATGRIVDIFEEGALHDPAVSGE